MSKNKKGWARWSIIAGASLAAALVIVVVGYGLWLSFPQRAEAASLQKARETAGVNMRETTRAVVLAPDNPTVGMLVYPGARVEAAAYAYKLAGIAQKGVAVVIAKPLFNFALIDPTNPETYKNEIPNVNSWYVAGHSLGGVKACAVAGAEPQAYKGFLLLGAYCNNTIRDTSLAVLSISGANDRLTTPEDIETHKALLPGVASFTVIAGMNHAGFGDYGAQDGDGQMTAVDDDVRSQMTAAVAAFLGVE